MKNLLEYLIFLLSFSSLLFMLESSCDLECGELELGNLKLVVSDFSNNAYLNNLNKLNDFFKTKFSFTQQLFSKPCPVPGIVLGTFYMSSHLILTTIQ